MIPASVSCRVRGISVLRHFPAHQPFPRMQFCTSGSVSAAQLTAFAIVSETAICHQIG